MFLLLCMPMPFINTWDVSFHPDILCLFVVSFFSLLLPLLLSPQTLTQAAAADIVRQRQAFLHLERRQKRCPCSLFLCWKPRPCKDTFLLSIWLLLSNFPTPQPRLWSGKGKLSNMNSVLLTISQYLLHISGTKPRLYFMEWWARFCNIHSKLNLRGGEKHKAVSRTQRCRQLSRSC